MNYKKPQKAVITDAGLASRFLPLTKTIPKGLLPLGSRPIIELVIEECAAAGIKEILLVVSDRSKPLYEHYFTDPAESAYTLLSSQGKLDRFAPVSHVLNDLPEIKLVIQDPSYPYGNGSPIASVKDYIDPDEAFIALWSDDVVFGDSAVKDLLAAFEKHPDALAILGCQEVPHAEIKKYASVDFDPETEILNDLIEKPEPDSAPSDLASYGRYLLTPEIFTYLKPENTGKDNELWLPEMIARLVPTQKVFAKKTSGLWMTTGDPRNYSLALAKHILDSEPFADEFRDFVKNN
ncbi:NTP transferase domain-containing protein [Candidatus Saccharibacteria bacterium]|nr:NTP transferase domain-containing protein [Candidatus Saccharibacteria bacterium]